MNEHLHHLASHKRVGQIQIQLQIQIQKKNPPEVLASQEPCFSQKGWSAQPRFLVAPARLMMVSHHTRTHN